MQPRSAATGQNDSLAIHALELLPSRRPDRSHGGLVSMRDGINKWLSITNPALAMGYEPMQGAWHSRPVTACRRTAARRLALLRFDLNGVACRMNGCTDIGA